MKAYLAITGTLFAVLALAHVWKVIDEWPPQAQRIEFVSEAAIGILAASLAIWAWRLFRSASRSAA